MIFARPISYGILKHTKSLRVEMLFFMKVLLEILTMQSIATILILISNCFFDFPVAPETVEVQAMVIKVVEDQNAIATELEEQAASLVFYGEREFNPHNIQPEVPERNVIIKILFMNDHMIVLHMLQNFLALEDCQRDMENGFTN